MTSQPHYDNRTMTILLGVKSNRSQAELARVLVEEGVNHSNVVRRFHVLERAGLIERRRKGKPQFWHLTKAGEAALTILHTVYDTAPSETLKVRFRWHAVIIKFPYLSKPPAFERQLQDAGFVYCKRSNWSGYEGVVSDALVVASPVSVLVYLKEPERGKPLDAVESGCRRAVEIKAFLEKKYPGLRLNADGLLARQHMAVEGGVSEFFDKSFKYRSTRMMIDASTGKPETEFIHSAYGYEDALQLANTIEFLATDPRALGALKYLVSQGFGQANGKDEKQKDLTGYS